MRKSLLTVCAIVLPALAHAQAINTPPPSRAAFLDVVARGADPTGVADASTVINNTIAAACATTPPTPVFFPPGKYTMLAASVQPLVTCPAGAVLYGAGPGVTTLQLSATRVSNGSLLFIGAGATSVTVRDMTLDGNSAGTIASGVLNNSVLVSVFKGKGVVFDNVAIQNALGQGLQCTDCSSSGIRNSTVYNISQYWHTSPTSPYIRETIAFIATGGQTTGSISADGAGTGSGTIYNVTATPNGGGVEVGAAVFAGTFPNPTRVAYVVACAVSGAQTCSGTGGIGKYAVDTSLNYPAGTTLWTDPSALYAGNFVENVTASLIGADGVEMVFQRRFRISNLVCNMGSGALGRDLPSQQWYSTSTKLGAACVFGWGMDGLVLENIDSEVASGNGFDLSGLRDASIVGNQSNLSGWSGFALSSGNAYGTSYGVRNFVFAGNYAKNSGQTPLPPAPSMSGLAFSNGNITAISYFNGVVSNNVFIDDQVTPTQQYGISSQGSGVNNLIDNSVKFPATNVMYGNAVAPTLNVLALSGGNLLYSAAASQTMASTTATTCFASAGNGSQIIPQYSVVIGSRFRLNCSGTYTTPASSPGTVTVSLKRGSTVLATKATPTLPVSQTNSLFTASATCSVTSMAGTLAGTLCTGAATFYDANGVAVTAPIAVTTPVNFDVSFNGALDMLFAWSTVAGGQTATATQANMEMLN